MIKEKQCTKYSFHRVNDMEDSVYKARQKKSNSRISTNVSKIHLISKLPSWKKNFFSQKKILLMHLAFSVTAIASGMCLVKAPVQCQM